jgi:hypothetical protein
MLPEESMQVVAKAELVSIAIMVGISLISAGVQYYVARKKANELDSANAPTAGEIRFPQVTASSPIPVLFGTRRMSGPNVVWYGDTTIIQRSDGGREDEKRGIFRFHGNACMVFCRGPIDSVERIIVGDITADDTPRNLLSGPVLITIDKGSLFGGSRNEGGLIGDVMLYPGRQNQEIDPYLDFAIRGDSDTDITPAHRGVFSVRLGKYPFAFGVVSSFYHGTTPVIKPWAIEAKRIATRGFGDAQWYLDKAGIDGDMNPAHILRELIVDEAWGLGRPAEEVDDDAFTAVADALFVEGLGLSFLWTQDTSVFDFIREVDRHADTMTFINPFTGKWTCRLIRDDYDLSTIPALGPDQVMEISAFSRPSVEELVTMVTVIYRERVLDREENAVAHDTAGVIRRGEIVHSVSFPGASRASVANRLAQRELSQLSLPRASVELVVHENAAETMLPGDVFNLAWPDYGIERITLRVININWGSPTAGAVAIQCVEDAFAYGRTVYADPIPTQTPSPVDQPAAASEQVAFEIPLWLRAIEEGVNPLFSSSEWTALHGRETGRACLAVDRPSVGHSSYEMWVNTSGQDPTSAELLSSWADRVTTAESIGPDDTFLDINGVVSIGDLLLHETSGEIMRVTAFASGTSTMTLDRGLLDTTPSPVIATDDGLFRIGAYAEQAGDAMPIFRRAFGLDVARSTSTSEPREMELRARTITGAGQLPYDDATPATIDLLYRTMRPYPPGKTVVEQITGATPTDDLVRVTWEHRDRRSIPFPLQSDVEPFIPEIHVKYLLDIYEESPTPRVLRTEEIAGTVKFYEYTFAAEDVDRGGDGFGSAGLASRLRFELRSQRDDGIKTPDMRDLSYYAQIRIIQR